MNSYKLANLKISQCNSSDKTFNIFCKIDTSKIQPENSLLFVKPIIVTESNNGYKVVSGFQLLELFQKQKILEIPAYILPQNMPLEKIISIILYYVKQEKNLNILEISQIIFLLVEHGFDNKAIAQKFCNPLGIPPKTNIIQQYYSIQKIVPIVSNFLITKNAPLKMWKIYSELTKSKQIILAKILSKTNPSLSIFHEISTNLSEISRRDEIDFEQIIENLHLLEIFEKAPNQNTLSGIRQKIYNARYPTISKYRLQIAEKINKLDAPNNVKIIPDKTLETKNFKINCEIKSAKDLVKCVNFFKNNEEELKKFFA
ncbi:MAG: hypothetical protein U9P79_08250 [Candidatus Cloacimonadota bacterium]|nr:hypothetical protein [Candidatus Cloacimonadota bacterium]